jgi:lipoprotein NlpI
MRKEKMSTFRFYQIATAAVLLVSCEAAMTKADEPNLTAEQLEARGSEHFRAGRFAESVADFDAEIRLQPLRGPWHWKRGISLYYAGRYADGAKQFEGYQTVDAKDVENAVWRFLCMAKDPQIGPDRARREIFEIKDDRRVPMRQIHSLFAGKLKPDDVLTAVRADQPNEKVLNERLFYAHLYLGLYFDATGDAERAKTHLAEAVGHKIGHYMWDVAKVHEKLVRGS